MTGTVRAVQTLQRLADDRRAPVLVLALGAAAIALPIAHRPIRLVMNLLPYAVLFGVCWWWLRRALARHHTTAALASLAVVCAVPSYADDRLTRFPAPARAGSPSIWSATLQHPRQALAVYYRLPDGGRSGTAARLLVVRLERAYRGPASFGATINGTDLGPLRPPLPVSAGEPIMDERVVEVPSDVLAARPITEIVLRQDRPDPALRLVVYGFWAGAALGEHAAWFFDGLTWHRGVPEPLSGRVVAGLPNVELRDASGAARS